MKPIQHLFQFFILLVGLSSFAQAYYAPDQGRWLTRDPIGEQGGMNLYAFVDNNGVNKWDYLGNKPGETGGVFRGRKFILSYETKNLDVGNCGKYNWNIFFKVNRLPKHGGIVAQKVTYKTWDITDCKDGARHLRHPDFYELFGMADGSKISGDDNWGQGIGKCTKGKVVIEGKARFYENRKGGTSLFDETFSPDFAPNPDFGPNSVGPVDIGRRFFPGGADSNEITRTLTAEWDCCSGESATKISIK